METSDDERSGSCAGCLNKVCEDDMVSALGQKWHKECFRCSVCDAALSEWFFEKDGMLFCQQDYWARFADACQRCEQVIAGPVMSAGEHRLHAECFTCRRCHAPIETAQPYTLVDRSHLYCASCSTSLQPAMHAVRVIDVPRAHVTLEKDGDQYIIASATLGEKVCAAAARAISAALSLCFRLACYSIDTACHLLALRAGDRVLEVDGAPPAAAVAALATRDTQLTVEQDYTRARPSPPVTSQVPPERQPAPAEGARDDGGKRERIFKRKGDGGNARTRPVRRRRAADCLSDKERSSSLSQLVDVAAPGSEGGVLRGLSRARSFRAGAAPPQRVFRAADLLLGELLGCGFFGSVYKVTHCASGEPLVLKQLHRLDDDAQCSFLKEVAVLRSLQHPNVLRFVGVLYKDKRLHLVTEYVAGGTLYRLLQDTSVPLPWPRRAALARDVARGLRYLHAMSVIHRDLNSHNCLVRQDGCVVVADFGLARVAQRTSGTLTRNTLRRKRYTVVGNPYWMAPEMMNGLQYDERVDVFSFGIVLCEIIGRVSADPDFLPRRDDFGLHEELFLEKFCRGEGEGGSHEGNGGSHQGDGGNQPGGGGGRGGGCPEPLSALAFRCCRLEPDQRPPFEAIAPWLEALAARPPAPLPDSLAPEPPGERRGESGARGIVKSSSSPRVLSLNKCVSASALGPRRVAPGPRRVTLSALSRSQQALSGGGGAGGRAGFILRAEGEEINVTRVPDVAPWLDGPPPTVSVAVACENTQEKQRKQEQSTNLPAFLRNQSAEGLDGSWDSRAFSRHHSEPGPGDSDDDHYTQVQFTQEDKKREEKRSYQVNKEEKKSPEKKEPKEKTNFFTKRLMSPKLSRLFKAEPKKEEESKSKFFVQHPASPNFRYRVRPSEKDDGTNVIKSDLKLAGLGKPMTPIFRRHVANEYSPDGRFSYRKPKTEPKFLEIGRNKIKSPVERSFTPLVRSAQITNIAALTTVLEKDGPKSKIERDSTKKEDLPRGISRSNYVNLANLKINGKDLKKGKSQAEPVERVI